ncbi:MAG: teichuronic acid biosynthesis glycosyltransferase TuaH, partial [Actinomycetota bacterium]
VVIAATPMWAPVLRHLAADSRGFDAVDDWRALPAVATAADHVVAGYRAAALADSATAVSGELAEVLGRDFGLASLPIANGVDVDAFTGPVGERRARLPSEPFAIYLGVVQQRVDFDLIAAASSVMRVVVAGPAAPEFADALHRSDVTWLGPVEPAEIPDLLRAAAVGLVPHRVDALTTSMDPMKVLEYLAAGLPVVATPVRIGARSDRILVASGPAAFAEAVRAARDLAPLGHPDPAVDGYSWRAVADALFDAHIAGRR